MKFLHKLWDIITWPFVSMAVLVDESKRTNEDGSWDEYNRKRNERMMRKESKNK